MKARFLLTLAVAASAIALSHASLHSQIARMNKPILAAMKSRNVERFIKVVKGGVTSDFKYSEDGGPEMGFDGMVDHMRQGFAMYKRVTRANTRIVSCSESGDTGTAVEKHNMAGMMVGPDKKIHKMTFMGTSTETYTKVNGKWMMSSMAMKTDKMTMDGKPMSMPSGK